MTEIAERMVVTAPLGSAARLLARFMEEHPGPDGSARLTLRFRDLEAPALVSLTPDRHPGDMTPRYRVHWEAAEGGHYPVFDGELTVGSDEDYNAFWLVLGGSYEPPGGIVGRVFDAVFGHKVAEETARGLLSDMRDAIQRDVEREEAQKPHA